MKEKLKLFCILNQIAYLNKNEAAIKYNELGYTVLDSIDNSGVQGYILLDDTSLDKIFVFRGTDGKLDIRADLNIRMASFFDTYLEEKVHAGFMQKANIIKQHISHHTWNVKGTIYFTGHSYGAALALLLGIMLYGDEIITFGAPRIGNKSFSSRCNQLSIKHIRVRNNMDIITKLPLKLLGYEHHGELLYLDYSGNLIKNPSKWQLVKDAVKSRLKAWSKGQFWDGVYDHSLEKYYKKLE